MENYLTSVMNYCGIYAWQDVLEILFFSCVVYAVQVWLSHDTHKPLLGYWYGYCSLWILSYCLQLATLTCAMSMALPVLLIMFVLVHQRTLQKNYVALHSQSLLQTTQDGWLDQLLKTALVLMNMNKPFWCIIEHTESLETMVHTDVPLDAAVTNPMLMLLLEHTSLTAEKCLWITTKGNIRGIHAAWNGAADVAFVDTTKVPWQQDASFFTGLTDALMLYVDAASRSCTLVVSGAILEHLTVQEVALYIKKHQSRLVMEKKKERVLYGSRTQRSSSTEQISS